MRGPSPVPSLAHLPPYPLLAPTGGEDRGEGAFPRALVGPPSPYLLLAPTSSSPRPCLKTPFRVPDRECRGAEPLCRGHGGVPRIWLYHPLPGEEGGRGDGRNGRGAPTPQQQDRCFEAKLLPTGGEDRGAGRCLCLPLSLSGQASAQRGAPSTAFCAGGWIKGCALVDRRLTHQYDWGDRNRIARLIESGGGTRPCEARQPVATNGLTAHAIRCQVRPDRSDRSGR